MSANRSTIAPPALISGDSGLKLEQCVELAPVKV
jgi:hypothetical protein